jgi:Protein of unknown function (DUF3551)
MKPALRTFLLATVFGAAGLTPSPSLAQDYPWCLQGKDYGYPGLCQFVSYPQCQATASGTFSYCGINPRFAFAPPPDGIPRLRRWR